MHAEWEPITVSYFFFFSLLNAFETKFFHVNGCLCCRAVQLLSVYLYWNWTHRRNENKNNLLTQAHPFQEVVIYFGWMWLSLPWWHLRRKMWIGKSHCEKKRNEMSEGKNTEKKNTKNRNLTRENIVTIKYWPKVLCICKSILSQTHVKIYSNIKRKEKQFAASHLQYFFFLRKSF